MNKIKNEKWFSGLDYIEKVPEKLYILPDFLNLEIKETLAFARYSKWVKFPNPKEVVFYSKSKRKIYKPTNKNKAIGFTTFNGGNFILLNEENNTCYFVSSSDYGFAESEYKTYYNLLSDKPENVQKIQNYFEELEILKKQEEKVKLLKDSLYDSFIESFEELNTIFPKKRMK